MNPQSGQGGGRGINTDASCLNHGCRGETDFRDRSNVKNGRSKQSQVADNVNHP